MLKVLHRYRIIFLVVISFASIALALSGFVHNFFMSDTRGKAITVNGEVISYERYQQARRELEQLYRSMYGQQYYQVLQAQNVNLANQVADKMIDQTALRQAAKAFGISVSEDALRREIQSQLGTAPSIEQYRFLLNQLGMTAQQFEEQMRESVMLSQVRQIVTDLSTPSQSETAASVEKEKTNYSVVTVSVDAKRYESQAKEPTPDEIKAYYEENNSDFELPARIKYNYAILDPAKFLDLVEVSDDDVEFYYSENETSYMKPARLRAHAIQIGIKDEKSTPTSIEIEVRRKKAEEARARVEKGESIESLSKEYTSDLDLSQMAGDLGTPTEEELKERFGEKTAQALFALKPGDISQVLENDGVFLVATVEEKIESVPRPLADVRADIEKLIREREAPAYVADHALSLTEKWQKSKQSLAELLAAEKLTERGITVKSTNGLLTANEDPDGISGLTAFAIENPEEARQLADLPEHSVLVEISESREPEVKSLAEVTDQIKENLKRRAAQEKATAVAEELRKSLAEGKAQSLKDAAKAVGLEAKETTAVTRATASGPLANDYLQKALFSITEVGKVSPEAYSVNGAKVIFQVTAITPPSADEIQKSAVEARARQTMVLSQLALESLIKRFRQDAEVEIEPGVLGQPA